MKNIRNNTLILLMLLITSSIFAQFGGMTGAMMPQVVVAKVKLVSGDLSQIKGKKLKLQLTFDGMLVSKYKMMFGKKISEDEFIKNKSADLNEKEAGKGDEWASKWKSDKENRYVPSFITKFNEMSNEFGTTISSTEGDITVVVHTSYTEPGYFIGIEEVKENNDYNPFTPCFAIEKNVSYNVKDGDCFFIVENNELNIVSNKNQTIIWR